MTNRSNITTGKPPNCGILCRLGVILLVVAAWVPAFAHGGFEHVRGTVVKVANNVLTIKTAKGNVDVKLDSKTELTKDEQKAQLIDLKPGTRVVVDLPEGGKDPTAHSVKIGTLTKTVDEHRPRK
jgi:hypothetical protein